MWYLILHRVQPRGLVRLGPRQIRARGIIGERVGDVPRWEHGAIHGGFVTFVVRHTRVRGSCAPQRFLQVSRNRCTRFRVLDSGVIVVAIQLIHPPVSGCRLRTVTTRAARVHARDRLLPVATRHGINGRLLRPVNVVDRRSRRHGVVRVLQRLLPTSFLGALTGGRDGRLRQHEPVLLLRGRGGCLDRRVSRQMVHGHRVRVAGDGEGDGGGGVPPLGRVVQRFLGDDRCGGGGLRKRGDRACGSHCGRAWDQRSRVIHGVRGEHLGDRALRRARRFVQTAPPAHGG